MPATLKIRFIILAVVALFASSCSNSKHLVKGESLFIGSKITFKDAQASKKEKKLLRSDLKGIVRPKPNSTTLGVRLKLRLYNAAGDTKKKKGIRQWLRNKVGEPPVLASSVHMDINKALMTNYLENRGYFYSKVSAKMQTDTNKKKSHSDFEIATGFQYKIKQTYFRTDSTRISVDVDSDFSNTLLKSDAPYNLELIKAERTRIERMLKEKGYFYFKADYVLVIVDSSIGDHKVNMYVKLKHKEIPPEAYTRYTINNIFIYASYKLSAKAQDTSKEDAVKVDSYYVID